MCAVCWYAVWGLIMLACAIWGVRCGVCVVFGVEVWCLEVGVWGVGFGI